MSDVASSSSSSTPAASTSTTISSSRGIPRTALRSLAKVASARPIELIVSVFIVVTLAYFQLLHAVTNSHFFEPSSLYADETSFTVMTAEGLPEAGWNTFSAHEEDGATVVQIQSLARASDPIYEIGFRMFGSTEQERIWTHVLTSLAVRFGVDARVELRKACVDPKLQWSRVGNLARNAGMWSVLYTIRSVGRRLGGSIRRT